MDSRRASLALLLGFAIPAAGRAESLQAELDGHPGQMVFVAAGDHLISAPLRVASDGAGLWGPGRIVQSNPEAAIVEVSHAARAELRDITLTRAPGARETHQPGLLVEESADVRVAGVRVIDNWSDSSAILVRRCPRIAIVGCLVRNYDRISVDDRTRAKRTAVPLFGYAFNCINGTGINIRETVGALIEDNRVEETRLLPTPEIKARYRLGQFVKRSAVKGTLTPQSTWDQGYVNIWRQGAGIHCGSGTTCDFLQFIGNSVKNSQQGLDIQADHVIVADNIVDDAAHGMKTIHGARNVIIAGNQFSRIDLFGIGLMQGTSSTPTNIDGESVVADNIVSDFGYGLSHWIWDLHDSIGPAPIQLGGSALPATPPLRDVLLEGNIVYDPGRDKILVNGQPQVAPPRYAFAVKLATGAAAPRGLHFFGNLFDPGTQGVALPPLRQ